MTPVQLVPSSRFKRDFRLVKKHGKDLNKLSVVINLLQTQQSLSPQHRDHALTDNWTQHRECHIEPDWLLIYKATNLDLFFERTGTHSDLFGK